MASGPIALVDRFGFDDAEWAFDAGADPSTVAALYRQHRLIVAARTHLGRSFTAAEVAGRLGALRRPGSAEVSPASVRKILRWLSGEQAFTMAEELVWRAAFGLRHAASEDLTDSACYPLVFARALARSADGALSFHAAPAVRWEAIGDDLLDLVEADLSGCPASLFTRDVLRMHVARALVRHGVNRHLLRGKGEQLLVLEAERSMVATVVAGDDDEGAYLGLLGAMADPHDCDVLIAVMGAVAQARLRNLFPQSAWTRPGQTVTVPARTFEALGRPMKDADAEWTVRASTEGVHCRLWVAHRKVASAVEM